MSTRALTNNSISGAIIGDGDRNELSFTVARATPCEVRFELFLAQIAPSLQNKNRAFTRKFEFGFGQIRRSTEFSNARIVEIQRKNDL